MKAAWADIAPQTPLPGPSPEAARHLVALPIDVNSGQRLDGRGGGNSDAATIRFERRRRPRRQRRLHGIFPARRQRPRSTTPRSGWRPRHDYGGAATATIRSPAVPIVVRRPDGSTGRSASRGGIRAAARLSAVRASTAGPGPPPRASSSRPPPEAHRAGRSGGRRPAGLLIPSQIASPFIGGTG